MSRTSSRVPRRAAALLAVGGLALTAACGGSSGGSSSTTSSKGVKGGTLYYLSQGDFEHLDPARVYVTNASDFGRLIYRTLMTYANKPGTGGTEVVPDLAEAPGVPSDNAKTWTYKIKKNQKYEDGTVITSKDIKYGVERTFSDLLPEGPPYYNQLLAGASAYKGPYKDKSDFKAIETPDDNTIVFHFEKPFGDADFAAALTTTSPVPQAKDTGVKYDDHPVSSGPYKIAEYLRGKSIHLVRNPNWVAKDSPAIGAYPDEIQGELALDGATIDKRLIASNGNDAFAVTDSPNIQPENVSTAFTDPQKKSHIYKGSDGSTVYSSMNTARGPFKDIKVRQALEVAYPLATARKAAGGPSVGDFATSVLAPTLKAHKDIDVYGQKANGFKGDPVKAKQMLADAGYPNGVSFSWDVNNTAAATATAAAVKAALAPAGFTANIQPVDVSKYYDTIGQPSKQSDLVSYAWIPDWPSASTVIPPLFTCGAIKPQGNNNPANYCNKEFDAKADQASQETDADKADVIWAELDKKLIEDAVVIPRYYGITTWFYGTGVKNVRSALPFGGEIDLANVSVK
jgi:peptide/nickel transport system substrate-binding protein